MLMMSCFKPLDYLNGLRNANKCTTFKCRGSKSILERLNLTYPNKCTEV